MKMTFNPTDWNHLTWGNDAPQMGEHEIVIEKDFTALSNWRSIDYPITPGKSYGFTVTCQGDNLRNATSAFALLTFRGEDGTMKLRAYAMNADEQGTTKRLNFLAEEGWQTVQVDLGLRGVGRICWQEPELVEIEPEKPRRKLKIATTFLRSKPTTEETLANMLDAVDRAVASDAPDMVLFSEALYDHAVGKPYTETAETLDGPQCRAISAKAKEKGIYILIDMHEKDAEGRMYNAAVLYGRDGQIAAYYRKCHLTVGEYAQGLTPGDELPVFDTEFGKIGILICWDAYFPEPARVLGLKGAELILISTVGNPGRRHIARAMENGVYVAVSGAQDDQVNGQKPSRIISPEGKVLAETNVEGDYAVAEIDLSHHGRIFWLSVGPAQAIPENIYAVERRPDLYGLLSETHA